jgi:hypothetical protein
MNYQRVPRLGPLNEEGTGLRVRSLTSLDASSVASSRINCRSDYVVARLDSQNGLMARGERIVEFLGLEPMCFGEAGGGQQQRNE